jgi:hypothetical protein
MINEYCVKEAEKIDDEHLSLVIGCLGENCSKNRIIQSLCV